MLPPKLPDESDRLAVLRRYQILDTPAEVNFDDVTRLIASICETPIAVINFIDAGRQWFKSEVGLGVKETPLDTSICAYALLQEHLMVIPDLQKDERFACNPLVCAGPQWRFYAGAQLKTDDNYALGTLCVLDFRPRELNERQQDALAILARQVIALLEARRNAVLREQAIIDARREIAQRERAEAALNDQLNLTKTITDNARSCLLMMDAQGRGTFANPAAERVTGFKPEELIGEILHEKVHHTHPDGTPFPIEECPLDRALPLQEVIVGYEDVFVHKDGRFYPVRCAARPILTEGKPTGTVIEVQDITEEKRAREALVQADHRKDQFLAMLAHELRNPLAPLSNALALWPMIASDQARMDQLRQMMDRQLQQMTRLIDDLLDVSRITRGKIELRRQHADLSTVINDAVEAARPIIEQQRHKLRLALPEALLRIDADVTRLAQVFGNLLNNAAKYTPTGGEIWLHAHSEGEHAVVRVQDNGPGIPRDMLASVFDLFVQVDQTLDRAQGGMGIGLTLCKNLIEMHGGSIEARSKGANRGSEFVVRLPILPVEETSARAANDAQRQTTAHARRRVLVVDDAEASADTLGMVLEALGHEARVTYDGPNALSAAREFNPEFIFLDIAMPKMNGYEVAKRLRAEPTLKGLALIALTGFGQEEDRRRALAAGFDHHLVKPVSLDAIAALLADFSPRRAHGHVDKLTRP